MVIGDSNIVFDGGSGGTGGGQPSVCTSISGYYINPGTGNILIKDYCPLFNDCQVTQAPELKNASGDNYLELISYYADDVWTEGVTLPYYCGSSLTQLVGIRRGTKPQFNDALRTFSSGETITITRTANLLTFTDSLGTSYTFGPSFFKDGAIPTCIFVTLQGGGGGGGSSTGVDDQYPGAGGGGGAFGQILLNLLKVNGYFRLIVGSGGIGRYKDSGTPGTASSVQWVESGTGTPYNIAVASGGSAGRRRDKHETGAGGTFDYDPSYLNNRYFYMVGSAMRNGANGGEMGAAGNSLSALDLFATYNLNDRIGINKQTFTAKNGGTSSTYRGGGGGASMSANGANGGTYTGGLDGSLGSGGSGGGSGRKNQGGNGGDGYISIYY